MTVDSANTRELVTIAHEVGAKVLTVCCADLPRPALGGSAT